MQLYVLARSKRDLNARLEAIEKNGLECSLCGYLFEPWSVTPVKLVDAPHKTVIKLYTVRDAVGNPVAKSYGTWNAKKRRVE